MNSKKAVTLYGYKVTYYDLREQKPREPHTAGECIRAAEVLKGSIGNYIEDNFASKGYFVKSIEKQKARRVLVDYRALYETAPTIEELDAQRQAENKKGGVA